MHITIDADKCTGHGVCEALAEDVFEVRDDGLAHLLIAEVPDDRQDVHDAVQQCPARAITVSVGSASA